MGKLLLASVTFGLMATPAFGITFMSLNENLFEEGSFTASQTEFDQTAFIESAVIAPRYILPGFADQEETTAFPEM